MKLTGWNGNSDDDYYEDDVDLRWFLLQTLVLVFAMVSCVRCISACIAYRDAQLYEQLLANNPNLANQQGNGSSGRQRWVRFTFSFDYWFVNIDILCLTIETCSDW